MPNIWNYFKNLFREAEKSSPSQPLIHEMIQRSAEEKSDYEHWKNTLVCRRLRDWLFDQYAIFRVAPDDIDESLDFLDTQSSKGFVVHLHKTQYSKRDAAHFLDFLKEKVLELGYRAQISDLRTYNRPDWVETVERHYLKPKPVFLSEGKIPQKYGNVTIELLLRNEKVYHLKFRATCYHDHQFEEAEEFKDLMQSILT